jgi:hypothetical protein
MSKLLLFFLIFVSAIYAVFPQYNPGAKQISVANSDVAQSNNVFAIFSNPAGLAQMNWREIGLFYSPAPFGFTELANGYIGYNEPFSFGSIGIGAMTYGFDLYRESRVLLAFSYNYNNIFFAGASLNYHSVSIKKYGSSGTLYGDLGGIIYITNFIRWGFAVHNINHASYSSYQDQIPVILNTGFCADILEDFSITGAVEKDIRYNASVSAGFEYNIIKYLSIRTGFSDEPSRFTAGIGIHYTIFNLNYAVFTHQDLGLTHQMGLIISFGSDLPRREKIRTNLGIK